VKKGQDRDVSLATFRIYTGEYPVRNGAFFVISKKQILRGGSDRYAAPARVKIASKIIKTGGFIGGPN
jgi:hypothetical protein